MKTSFEKIVDVQAIGGRNPEKINDLSAFARSESFPPSAADTERVLFVGIDFQNDFMENGELGVPHSHRDIENATKFIYHNLEKITTIAVSIDTHQPKQIFHPFWWVDGSGKHPEPLTIITLEDVEGGKWTPAEKYEESLEYVRNLEKSGKKQLCIWPFHCIQGTTGAALESQFSNMIHFHSFARNANLQKIVKGLDPLSEMYGIIKPEYDRDHYCNHQFLESLKTYDKIIVAGEAKSHCVLESVKQIAEHYADNREITSRIFLLEDCMSPIPGFEKVTAEEFNRLRNQYKVNIVTSESFTL
ncbi:hypothetical protein ELQ35_14090 [Peribacillus cavernae]|uniref:Nicotinamidase n=1 Tax=Peribacillus cavernae TaxID=1674310 RepID=A0A433HI42_9BACI|nr:hypothetical protein [Peribacillus cavernae]MDQ0220463.1 nicotinamidase-related amidase [Peribacillus cavernae]RUQ28034.1 hypothetical protein ELQ35_14090 [Peribacillus cavernae]